MRPSILSRSVVAIATLAVGSAALSATPASAATASGVTREMVLTTASALRAGSDISGSTEDSVRFIVERSCELAPGEQIGDVGAANLAPGGSADGIVLIGFLYDAQDDPTRACMAAVTAATDAGFSLTGSSLLTIGVTPSQAPTEVVTRTSSSLLAGDVKITGPIYIADDEQLQSIAVTSSGSSTKVSTTTTHTKVKDKKTKAQKKKAKKRYVKRLKAAKSVYKKALKKAGTSKTKKSAAKKAYAKKRASAKKVYRTQTANYKIVTKRKRTVDNRPFSLSFQES